MKFIHTADLHLDTPFDGIKNDLETPTSLWQTLKNAPYKSFQKIIDQAVNQKIDFMLIAGDVFDSKNQSVKALSFFIEQINRLNDAQIPVLLSFGNHDFQPDQGKHFDFPANVFIFPKEVTTHELTLHDGKRVAVTSFSYPSQAVTTDLVQYFPLKGNADYQIGMVHGEIGKDGKDNYAPFTISEMKSKGYDYWALGHIHKRSELNQVPMIEYPGDIQGRHKNEVGEKGYLLVDDQNGHLNKTFVPTSTIIFSPMTIKVDENMDITMVVNKILITLKDQDFTELHLINLTLESQTGEFSEDVSQRNGHDFLISNLQRELSSQYEILNAWIYEIKLKSNSKKEFSNLDQVFWNQAKVEVFSKENIADLAGKLFVDDFIRNEFNSDESANGLMQKSEELIKSEMKGVDTDHAD
ncbi:metallophosphoesterase family protein [Fructilactobacillus sanfranciscensis]|uniref:metallophosphoesterase family protein n=1 Tax=Fructilactobacillus sanfranciscensis TaxID=1625 RepID=UPI000D46523B|nr:DNA repair exonuclease [Fructilactobacillus sanfranciscensis]POH19435.1 metallophosphoesterase [Fructilactobacillus sanfranciscensis]